MFNIFVYITETLQSVVVAAAVDDVFLRVNECTDN